MTTHIPRTAAGSELPEWGGSLPPITGEVQPIGVISTPYVGKRDCPRRPWTRPEISRIALDHRYLAAAEGLSEGTRVYLLWWAHQADRSITRRRVAPDAPEQGVFVSRGPDRPNPIGLTLAVIVHVNLPQILVRGADCVDQTPLLDIKPALVADNTLWQ